MNEGTESPLVMEPDASRWGEVLRAPGAPPDGGRMRRELGLSAPGRVILAGHQAVFWHPGILAKWLAVGAAARRAGVSAAWVVVDHDTDDPWSVRYPARGAGGRLVARVVDVRGDGARRDGVERAVCRVAATDPAGRVPDDAASEGIAAGLAGLMGALRRHRGALNAARQVTGATIDLLSGLCDAPAVVYSSELSRTSAFMTVVDEMDRGARECVLAYNAAVRAAPGSGLRALYADEVNERYELPLWRVGPDGVRRKVYAEDLAGVGREELMPRALMMTALLRLGACELFVHGTGGGMYERANDAWISSWLGAAAGLGRAAPVAVVTATRRLTLLERGAPTAQDVARARWTAHHAHHDPAMVGDEVGAARRRELVGAIRSARREGRVVREAFAELQGFLRAYRVRTAGRLEELAREAHEAAGRVHDAEVEHDRTWAFPMYPRSVLEELATAIAARLEGGA